MTNEEKQQLDQAGYLVVEAFMSDDLLSGLRSQIDQLFEEEGENAGSEFKQEPGAKRLANLVDKGEIFHRILLLPEILDYVRCVLGPKFKLSSLNARSASPSSECRQPLHADAGAVMDEKGSWVCNVVWMLDDFTPENGAIRMVPGSHCWGILPRLAMEDPYSSHPEEVLVTGPAGSIVVMNAHIWHGGTANRTRRCRRAVHTFYTRWDKPQQQYQKKLVRPEVQKRLSPELRRLLALDDPLNDELTNKCGGQSGFMK